MDVYRAGDGSYHVEADLPGVDPDSVEVTVEPGFVDGIMHRRDQAKARGVTAADLMTTAVAAVRPDDTVEHAARLMYDRGVKRLPVTDENRRLVGIISRADVLSVFDRPDAAIRKEITHDVLLGEFLVDPKAFQVTVMDGIVTLAGRPGTRGTGHEIVRRVRHVPGVVAVRDRHTYPPPPERPASQYDVLASFRMV
jgi:hypothetical protein